ncbi:MAG TPA: hypothetical protein VKR42_14415 [Ktedonobacteraceae bacterium]|nr:hypothetical protein [Ktedonobacteraceae bacterium]
MSIHTESVSTPAATITCPRCGKQLPVANVACNQRGCRPTALRRVSLVALAPLDNAENPAGRQRKPVRATN